MTKTGKVWGSTVDIETNPFVSFHRAEIKQGFCCSKHCHTGRSNLFFVESGRIRVRVYQPNGLEDETILSAGQMTKVAPGVKHRFECLIDAVVYELYWPRLMTESDINRDDTGGRTDAPAPTTKITMVDHAVVAAMTKRTAELAVEIVRREMPRWRQDGSI